MSYYDAGRFEERLLNLPLYNVTHKETDTMRERIVVPNN